MLSRVRTLPRAAAAALAVAAYVLPMSWSVLTYLTHDIYHLREYLGHVEPPVLLVETPQPGDFVHEHGGKEHSHDAATDALLGAAERTDDPADGPHAPALELVGHLPARASQVDLAFPLFAARKARVDEAATVPATRPLLPPPRA